ncbi:MAG TPA: hypothetical protein GXX30_02840 [Firmicutes bacterium]|nr:hypothetical protein [Candidatus Fermentithermobacillaceae bacterium]
MRREIPVIITAVAGMTYVLAAFFDVPVLSAVKSNLDKWYLIVTAATVFVGVVNLISIHYEAIIKKKPGRFQSIVLLLSMFGTIGIGLIQTAQGKGYSFLFQYVLNPLSSTTYSLLCFYIASAAYRAFRLRSLDGTLLLVSGVIIMLGTVPVGDAIWKGIPLVSGWLLNVPNTAGMRGIMIGATLGGIATAARIVLGIERGHLGRAE